MAPLTVNTPLQPSELLSSADSRAAIRRRFMRTSGGDSLTEILYPRVLACPILFAECQRVGLPASAASLFSYTLPASPVGEQGAFRIRASHWSPPLPIATLSITRLAPLRF